MVWWTRDAYHEVVAEVRASSYCVQVPIPEISRLRTGQSWTVRDQEVLCGDPVLIPGPPRPALDISLILQRCDLLSSHVAWLFSACPLTDASHWQYPRATSRLPFLCQQG